MLLNKSLVFYVCSYFFFVYGKVGGWGSFIGDNRKHLH